LEEVIELNLLPNLILIAQNSSMFSIELKPLLSLLLACAVRCDNKENFVMKILTLSDESKLHLMMEIEKVL